MIVKILGKVWKKLPPWVRLRVTRVSQQKFTVSVAGIITRADGRVLLLNHVLRPGSGWGIPGGFIGYAEQPEDAFRREIREETGIELSDISLYRIRTLKAHLEIMYTAKTTGEAAVKSREIIGLEWFEPDNVPVEMNLDQQFLIRKVLLTNG